jgi:Tfp pilus assembly protein PilO
MRYKSTKIIAVVGLLFFIVAGIALGTLVKIIANQKVQFVEMSSKRSAEKSHQESLATLMKVLDETMDDREIILSQVLREEDVIDYLARIESLGKQSGLQVRTDSLTVTPINENFESLIVKISVEGPYGAIEHILRLLEYLPYHSYVSAVSFTRQENGLWSGAFEVKATKFKKK